LKHIIKRAIYVEKLIMAIEEKSKSNLQEDEEQLPIRNLVEHVAHVCTSYPIFWAALGLLPSIRKFVIVASLKIPSLSCCLRFPTPPADPKLGWPTAQVSRPGHCIC
jgi:hypothetical protein